MFVCFFLKKKSLNPLNIVFIQQNNTIGKKRRGCRAAQRSRLLIATVLETQCLFALLASRKPKEEEEKKKPNNRRHLIYQKRKQRFNLDLLAQPSSNEVSPRNPTSQANPSHPGPRNQPHSKSVLLFTLGIHHFWFLTLVGINKKKQKKQRRPQQKTQKNGCKNVRGQT